MQQKLLDSKLTQELSEVKLMLQNLPISLQKSSSGVCWDSGLLRSGFRPVAGVKGLGFRVWGLGFAVQNMKLACMILRHAAEIEILCLSFACERGRALRTVDAIVRWGLRCMGSRARWCVRFNTLFPDIFELPIS